MKRTVFITGAASGLVPSRPGPPGTESHHTRRHRLRQLCSRRANDNVSRGRLVGRQLCGSAGLGPVDGSVRGAAATRFRCECHLNTWVNNAIFDLVRAGGGRIVNISSESGRFPSRHHHQAVCDDQARTRGLFGCAAPGVAVRRHSGHHHRSRFPNAFPLPSQITIKRWSRSPDARVQGKRNMRGTRRSWRAPYIARSPAGGPSPDTWSMEECRAELWTFCQGRWLTRSSSWG